ncbi:MAG: oxaloacetate decarboxylase [Dongiaceae bacterium]
MKRTTRLRQLIEADPILMLPGAHDALSARIAEQAGFQAVTCGGYASSASLLGAPDVGQLSMSEMADVYARLCDAVAIPVFADADTGYGNTTNVARTLRAYERAGVAGLFIEDQVSPKRCGHMQGKQVVPPVEMMAKLKAALDARQDADLVLMARTDARAIEGIDAAIERANLYLETGVDLIFVEAPQSIEEMRRICSEIAAPCFANYLEGGRTPLLSAKELEDIGFAVVAYPVSATYAIARTLQEVYAILRRDGETESFRERMLEFDEFNRLVGLDELRAREDGYAAEAAGGFSGQKSQPPR